MKTIITTLFFTSLYLAANAQSPLTKRLELKRLALENKYRSVGIFDTLTGIATVYDNAMMGYIDTNGKLVLPIDFVTRDFSDGVGIYQDELDVFKVIDKKGKTIKVFKNIATLSLFKNGRAIFSEPPGNTYGVMDLDGNVIIKNIYSYIKQISQKYYFVRGDGISGIINAWGDTVVPLEYNIAHIDTSDLHFTGYKKGVGYAFFDSSGRVIKFLGKDVNVEKPIWGVPYFHRDSVIIITDGWGSDDPRYALMNIYFDTIIPMGKYRLSAINGEMVSFYERLIVSKPGEEVSVNQNTNWGFLNTRGEVVIPAIYDYAELFTEGLSAAKKNNKWGYIDKTGKTIIPFQFDYALPFSRGYAKVKLKDEFFIIDKKGQIVLKSKQN